MMLALSRGLAAPPRCRGHGAGQHLLREGLGLRTILVQTPNPNPEPISPRLKMNMISLPSEEALWQACRVQGYSIIAMVCLAISCKANFNHLCSQVERSNVVAKMTKMTIKKAGAGSSTDPVQKKVALRISCMSASFVCVMSVLSKSPLPSYV